MSEPAPQPPRQPGTAVKHDARLEPGGPARTDDDALAVAPAVELTRQVVVRNLLGIHARPSVLIAKAACRYNAAVTLEIDGEQGDCRHVMSVMMVAAMGQASQGKVCTLKAHGPDALAALDALEELFENGFCEE